MNVEIGAEAALFPEKEYVNGIAVAVRWVTRNGSHWFMFRECKGDKILEGHTQRGCRLAGFNVSN
jgi:hypothetical protein